ncbi:hypothetical protein QUA30_25415 [Microcoleus sp. Pol14C2]|uniref:hypothetical protein n=1 Tax=unclassified Microcoleus TaxID=2642155 RepID=UPI002FD7713A
MTTKQINNTLKITDKGILTPVSGDAAATTRYKDYILQVDFASQPVTIELFKGAATPFDPFLEVYRIAKDSTGDNIILPGTPPVAENDDDGGAGNSKIAPGLAPSFRGIPGQLTSDGVSDYVVRVTTYDALPDAILPQNFTLQASTNAGEVTWKDSLTGQILDTNGNPVGVPPGGGTPGGGTPGGGTAPGTNAPVRRFWDNVTQAHFYTSNSTEIADRLTNPRYRSEGDEFIAPGAGNVQVRRFLNTATGTYFYTADPGSIALVKSNLPQFTDQGDVFSAYASSFPGAIPVYRFANLDAERRNSQAITHFYTADPATRQKVINELPNFRDEGVTFYALPSK